MVKWDSPEPSSPMWPRCLALSIDDRQAGVGAKAPVKKDHAFFFFSLSATVAVIVLFLFGVGWPLAACHWGARARTLQG